VSPGLSALHRVPAWVWATALYGLLALYATFPVWLYPDTGVVGNWQHPDMISNHWLYRWVAEQLGQGGSLLHNDRYYLPIGDAPWLAGNGNDAVFAAPLLWLLPWPLSVTVWVLGMLVLNGLAGYAFCRASGASAWASTLGGAALTLSTYALGELSAGRFAQAPLYWTGFFLALWVRQLEEPTRRRGLLAGLCFGAAAFTYPYQGLWAGLLGVVLWLGRPGWRSVVTTAPAALLACLPLGVFLGRWHEIPGTAEQVFPHPITLDSSLPWTWPLLEVPAPLPQGTLPLLILVLAGIGLVRAPAMRRWLPTLAGALLFYGLSLGPELRDGTGALTGVPGPFLALYGLAPPLERFWWPYRHGWMVLLALLPLAAWGAGALPARLWRWPPATLGVLVGLLVLEDGVRRGTTGAASSLFVPPEPYAALADLPRGHLLELPLVSPWTRSQQSLSYQWVHQRDLVNGHAMWVERVRPDAWDAWLAQQPLLAQLAAIDRGEGPRELVVTRADLRDLQDRGVRYVTVNTEYYTGELEALAPIHRQLLRGLFGEPILSSGEYFLAWDLDRWTGRERVPVAGEGVASLAQEVDPSALSLRPESSLGWTTLAKGALSKAVEDTDPDPGGDADAIEANQDLPPAVRRTRARELRELEQAGENR